MVDNPQVCNNIEIDVNQIQDVILRNFVLHEIEKINAKDVSVTLSRDKYVYVSDISQACKGFFCNETRQLQVACGQADWINTLIHEGCHFDQWVEQTVIWEGCYIGGVDAGDLEGLWIDHKIELNDQQVDDVINRLINVELDCETRTVEKIKKYHLPIDQDTYIQQSIAHILLYCALKHKRDWHSIEPEDVDGLINSMPTTFNSIDFYNPPHELVDKIITCCFQHEDQ